MKRILGHLSHLLVPLLLGSAQTHFLIQHQEEPKTRLSWTKSKWQKKPTVMSGRCPLCEWFSPQCIYTGTDRSNALAILGPCVIVGNDCYPSPHRNPHTPSYCYLSNMLASPIGTTYPLASAGNFTLLIYTMNDLGPTMEPCGTPHLTDLESPTCTNWLFRNSSSAIPVFDPCGTPLPGLWKVPLLASSHQPHLKALPFMS